MPNTIAPEQTVLHGSVGQLEERRRQWNEALRAARIQPPTRYDVLPVDRIPPARRRPAVVALALRLLAWLQ